MRAFSYVSYFFNCFLRLIVFVGRGPVVVVVIEHRTHAQQCKQHEQGSMHQASTAICLFQVFVERM